MFRRLPFRIAALSAAIVGVSLTLQAAQLPPLQPATSKYCRCAGRSTCSPRAAPTRRCRSAPRACSSSTQDLIKKGMTLEQVKAARPTFEYDTRYGANASFIEAVYRNLGGSR